jgi:hypothetical protein
MLSGKSLWASIPSIISLTILGSVIGTLLVSHWLRQHPSSLTAGLHGTWAAATEEFSSRLNRRFPPGTPQTSLFQDLSREGFSPGWSNVQGEENRAYRDESTWVCRIEATVRWRSNEAGQVISISGEYQERGCL